MSKRGSGFQESDIEGAVLAWFEALGWRTPHYYSARDRDP